jgi:hypothetical protein
MESSFTGCEQVKPLGTNERSINDVDAYIGGAEGRWATSSDCKAADAGQVTYPLECVQSIDNRW